MTNIKISDGTESERMKETDIDSAIALHTSRILDSMSLATSSVSYTPHMRRTRNITIGRRYARSSFAQMTVVAAIW